MHVPTVSRLSPLLVGIALTATLAAQRVPDIRVERNAPGASNSQGPQMCASGKNVYVAWQDDRDGTFEIYFNRSVDGGVTWLPADIRLNTDVVGIAQHLTPRIACQGQHVYVVWSDFRNGGVLGTDIYFNVSSDGGDTWLSSDVRLDTNQMGFTASRSPVICATGSSVYVAWLDRRNGADDIYLNRSVDHGMTWLLNDVRLDTSIAGTALTQDLTIACAGSSVFAVWSDYRFGAPSVFLNHSSDNGTTWAASDVRMNTNPVGTAVSLFPAVAAHGSSAYVAWSDSRDGLEDIRVNMTKDGGQTWLPADVRLDTDPAGAASSLFPVVRASGNDVYVVWEESRFGPTSCTADIFINRSHDGGATWLPTDTRISNQPPPCSSPLDHSPAGVDMSMSGDGIYVTWLDLRNGMADTYYNRSLDKGATWLPVDVPMEGDVPGASFSTSAAVRASGDDVYVIWEDERNGAADIFLNVPHGLLPYGSGKVGEGGFVPVLSGNGRATLGNTFTLDASSGLGGTAGLLLLGAAKVSVPFFGGTVLVLPAVSVPIVLGGSPGVPGAGTASIPFRIPGRLSGLGDSLFFQMLLIDGAATQSVSMTNGVELWIG